MLDEVPPQKLETLEVPTEQDRAVLISHLEGFNGPGNNCLELLLGAQKLLILLQGQLMLSLEFVARSFHFLLQSGRLAHGVNQVLL